MAWILFQAPKYKPENYHIFTEKEWKELQEDGYPEHVIRKEDEKKKKEVDEFLQRTILKENTLEHIKNRKGKKPKWEGPHKELQNCACRKGK